MSDIKSDKDALTVSIARKPVFDNRGRLWGYELFCVGSSEISPSGFPYSPDTAISVASSAYLCLKRVLQGGKKIIVDFSEKSVMDKLPYALPPILSAIKVGEEISRQPSGLEVLNRLKLDGYPIAVRSFTGNSNCEALYRIASIISIEIRGREARDIREDLQQARRYDSLLLASDVEDRRLYQICRELNFPLFSGAFFKYPDKVTIRKLSSNEILRFELLKLVEMEDPDIPRIAKAIQADATVSFRLLAFLNSAAFAFTQRIKSIQQAVSLLGWCNIKNWLRVILLTDLSQGKEAEELVLLSAQRGMFLEGVARQHDFWGFDPGSLHLLGLFSLLDALLDMPMAEIVSHLPIDNKLKTALCREPNNEYVPLVRLAQFIEEAKWADVDAMIYQLDLDRAKVMEAFQQSVDWADGLEPIRSKGPAEGKDE
ncbi:MAG: HDOD domain-containing protein [Acidobacteria bacterium]|nr:HDOD domain-containing protein [Acidobacteriota bacterium]